MTSDEQTLSRILGNFETPRHHEAREPKLDHVAHIRIDGKYEPSCVLAVSLGANLARGSHLPRIRVKGLDKHAKKDYTVGWVCAVPIEKAAVHAILDEEYEPLPTPATDSNSYTFGRVGDHKVVVGCLPAGRYGTISAATVITHMRSSFPALQFWLMVGIGGGVPSHSNDVRLGDIVISQPKDGSGGVIQYDFGKAMKNGNFVRTGFLNAPPAILLSASAALQAHSPSELGRRLSCIMQEGYRRDERMTFPGQDADRLFRADYGHVDADVKEDQTETCTECDSSQQMKREARSHDYPQLHYGLIASGNQVMKDGIVRDRICKDEKGILCFEMEAAGIMNDVPCLVIRGICDYSDSHKNKIWQAYAALAAAATTKELLRHVKKDDIPNSETVEGSKHAIPFELPLRRNKAFTGRQEELSEMHEHLVEGRSDDVPRIFALTGLGGMGKTQTTLEYAYQYQRDYTSIFWILAATEDTIRKSIVDCMQRIIDEHARIAWLDSEPNFENIGRRLGVPTLIDNAGFIKSDLTTFKIVRSAFFRWLRLSSNTRWLLLLDNVDDLESVQIEDYIPKQGGGAIVVTSRRPEFSRIALQKGLGGLDNDSAVKLLLELANIKAPTENIKTEATAIVRKLGNFPLAISHAGHYINETKISLSDYLSLYDCAFTNIHTEKPRLGWSYRNETVLTTWEMSFSRVQEQDEQAGWMLLMCSYLHPEEIFVNLWDNGESDMVSRMENKKRLSLLASYSLVRLADSGAFSVHPVVHTWARERLDQKDKFRVISAVIAILGRALGRDELDRESDKWDIREERRLATHSQQLSRFLVPCFPDFRQAEIVALINKSLEIQTQQEIQDQAAIPPSELPKNSFTLKLMTGKDSLLEIELRGSNSAIVVFCVILDRIALILDDYGRYDEAMQWYQQSLYGKEEVLGKDHRRTLSTVHCIAHIYRRQGKYNDSVQWYQRALAGREAVLGPDHAATIATVDCLAIILQRQRKFDEAMKLHKRALDSNEAADRKNLDGKEAVVLNGTSLDTLRTANNIGMLYYDKEDYEEAMRWCQRVLHGREILLGKDHPETLAIVHNITLVATYQEKFDEAVQWGQRAYDGRKAILGADHPDTLSTTNAMASILLAQGKFDEAMQWYQRALDGKEAVLGKDHPETATTVSNIALLYRRKEMWGDALEWYLRLIRSREMQWGRYHVETLSIVQVIATMLHNLQEYDRALPWCQRALYGREMALGKDDSNTLITVLRMAMILSGLQRHDEAEQYCRRAIAGFEKHHGREHEFTLSAINDFGLIFYEQGRYDEAMEQLQEALAGREALFGKEHRDTLASVYNIFLVFRRQEKWEEAEQWYLRSKGGSQ